MRNIATGHHASAQHKQTHQRPSERPPLQQSMAAGWSIGAASSARENRRLLTLPDDPQTGASEPTPGSLGEGLAGGRQPFCSVGGMCYEARGLIGAKEHLVMLPPWCARAPRAPMPSPACARKGQNLVSDQLKGRERVLGGREGTPIPAKPPRFCPTPVSLSSPTPLGKGERGMRAGEPACSQAASSSRSLSHGYPCRPAAHPQL